MEWVNHAGFIIQSDAVRLLCDPWIDGSAFNNGWNLLSPTKMKYQEFSTITHIWFSHEHPDHFNPPNLKKIPEEYRRRITVVFHYTKDKRVLQVCKSLGFKTEEMPLEKTVELTKGCNIICGMQGLIDSWLSVSTGDKTLLDMNDCVYSRDRALKAIKEKVGKVDVLFSQFSYANWVGNPDDGASHRREAERKREEMARQIRIFQPKHFIPCGSFVSFSHSENFFMNAAVNQIGDVYKFTSEGLGTPTIILYPGDKWEVGASRDSRESINKYHADYESVLRSSPSTSPSFGLPELQEAAKDMIVRCKKQNHPLLLEALPATVARIKDLGVDVELSYRAGMNEVHGRRPDIITSSDSLLYCLTTDWGGETLAINGRFQAPPGGNLRRFFRIFRVPQHNSYGNSLGLRFLGKQAIQRVRSMVAS